MSAYDPSKDKVLASRSTNHGVAEVLTVSIIQYNGGTPKFQISRQSAGTWIKLGRLTFDEANWIAKTITEMMIQVLEEAKR